MHILLKRFLAYLIDYTIVYVATRILSVIMWIFMGLLFFIAGDSLISLGDSFFDSLSSISSLFDTDGDPTFSMLAFGIILSILSLMYFLLPYWLYFSIFESSSHQATIGKRILKIRVMDLKGRRINFRTATKRFLARPEVLYAYIGWVIGVFMVIIFMRFETGGIFEQIQLYDNYSWFFNMISEGSLNLLFFVPVLLVVGINYYVYKNSENRQGLHDLYSKTLVKEIEDKSVSNNHETSQTLDKDGLFKSQAIKDTNHKDTLKWFGGSYTGQLKDGVPHGQGKIELPDNKSYHGTWVMGKPEGYGRLTSSEGAIYAGYFKSGKRHGIGVYQEPGGGIYAGKWQNGKLIKRTSKYEGYLYELFIKNNTCIETIASSLNLTVERAFQDIQELINNKILEDALLDKKSKRITFKKQKDNALEHSQPMMQNDDNNYFNDNQQKVDYCLNCHQPLLDEANYCIYCGNES